MVVQLNTSSAPATENAFFLENRLIGVKDDLESAEKDFSIFASKNTTIDLAAQAKAMIASGAELEGELIAAQTSLQGMLQIYSDSNVRVRAYAAPESTKSKRQLKKIERVVAMEGASSQYL